MTEPKKITWADVRAIKDPIQRSIVISANVEDLSAELEPPPVAPPPPPTPAEPLAAKIDALPNAWDRAVARLENYGALCREADDARRARGELPPVERT